MHDQQNHRYKAFIPISLVLFSAGCATTTDPAKGGFFSGIHALSTGAYEKRLDEKETALADERARSYALRSEASQTDRAKTVVDQDLASVKARSDKLRQETEALRRQLEQAMKAKNSDQRQYSRLLADTNALESQIRLVSSNPALSSQEKIDEINALTEKRNALEQALSALMQ